MAYRASAVLIYLGIALALLAGCENTNVGFCSGSAEFCRDFLDNTFGDDDEPDPPNDEVAITQMALTIANDTPDAVATAITQQAMRQLIETNADLVGLWLTAGTLGRLIAADHVSVTEFLDQNRAWLADQPPRSEAVTLHSGLSLFAAFTATRDPGLADLAAPLATQPPTNHPADQSSKMAATAERIVANSAASDCCQAREIAAAVIVLCPTMGTLSQPMETASQAACSAATGWLTEREAPAPR